MSTLLVIVPLLGVLVLNLPIRSLVRARAAFWFGLALCVWQLFMVIRPLKDFWRADRPLPLVPLNMAPTIDNTALVMFLAVAIVGAVALLVARHTVADAGKLFNFSNLLILAVAGMNGMVLAGDLFSLYIFLEVTAVASFVLIAFERGRDAFEGAFKYIVLSAAATVMILAAIALLMMAAGGVELADLGPVWKSTGGGAGRGLVAVAAALLLGGLAIKSGLVPFHGWLPDAYSAAPAPASVLLAGIVTKTTGVYALIRVVTTLFASKEFGFVYDGLLLIGAISVVIGALAALGQTDLKRMLAYSSISQVGYIILGLGVARNLGAAPNYNDPASIIAWTGFAGAILHLFNHAVFKTLLFVNAAAVEQQAGTRDMGRLGGVADRMPVTGLTSAIAFLSTAGIPPLAGFWSKLLIIVALWVSGHLAYAVIAILASIITLAYFLVMQRRVFFGKLAAGLEDIEEAGAWNTFACCFLAAITFAVGVGAPWLFGTFLLPIRSIL